jgi:hypothetical protein
MKNVSKWILSAFLLLSAAPALAGFAGCYDMTTAKSRYRLQLLPVYSSINYGTLFELTYTADSGVKHITHATSRWNGQECELGLAFRWFEGRINVEFDFIVNYYGGSEVTAETCLLDTFAPRHASEDNSGYLSIRHYHRRSKHGRISRYMDKAKFILPSSRPCAPL